MNDFEITSACDPYGLLACKIVQQAILDYRKLLCGQSAGAQTNLEEIRRFLRSQWCDDLLSYTDVNGRWVLARLEKESVKPKRKKAARGSRKVTVGGRTATINEFCREIGVDSSPAYRVYNEQGCSGAEEWLMAIRKARGL